MAPDPKSSLPEVCASLGLSLVEQLDVVDGGAQFLAHVTDSAGRHLLLKRASGVRGSGEFRVLQAFSAAGHVPRFLQEIDSITFSCEWVDGVTIDRSTRPPQSLLALCGRMLRQLHSVPDLPEVMPIRDRVSPAWVEFDVSPQLPADLAQLARQSASVLSSYEESEAVLLHGDVVPGNVLEDANGRLVFIDPIGFIGPAAWDIAQLAIGFPGRSRHQNLEDLVEGYGGTPVLLDEAFRYLALVFLGKNMEREAAAPGTHARLVAELRALAESFR